MKFILYQKQLSHLNVQRNFLLGFSVVLLLVVFSQTILLFFKQQRFIISPPELKQSYWVEGNKMSQSYVEEMALFFTHLLLDVTEANILVQGDVVLRYVKPDVYDHFKAKLLNDHKRLKKQQSSLQFTPINIDFVEPLIVDISGILANYIGGKKITQFKETYKMQLMQKYGRLFLESFEVIKSEQGGHDESNA